MKHRAIGVIAQGALTNSKRPQSYIEGVYPTHVTHGNGAFIFDNNGNKWLDFTCALGTNLFGYGNPKIVEAVEKAIREGVTYGISAESSVKLAELIKGKFSHMEKMKFLKSGSEGCSAAVRIARAFTGRLAVAAPHYNGWHDDFVSLTPPAKGVPIRYWMDKEISTEREYAAIIMEPIVTDCSEEWFEKLRDIRRFCDESGALLIFDETITAYRVPGGLVSKFKGIEPDITIMGKAVAGGLPLSIVGGRADIMDCDYFVSSTWGDDHVANNAAIAAFHLMINDYSPDFLWLQGKEFLDEFNAISQDIQIQGYPTRGVFQAKDDLTKGLFFQEMCKLGVLFGPSWFYNKHLHEHKEHVLSLYRVVIERITKGEVELEGKLPASPFAQKVREQ